MFLLRVDVAPCLMELDEAQVDQEILEQYEKKNKENIALLGGKSVNEGESSVNRKECQFL